MVELPLNNFIHRLYKPMFKEIVSGFTKFFTRDKVILFIVLFILGYALITYSDSKRLILDKMENGSGSASASSSATSVGEGGSSSVAAASSSASAGAPVSGSQQQILQPVANPSDLLPPDANSEWTSLNPVSRAGVAMPDLLQAGYHIGLDTIGQTLRNANLQLRSDPIIPKVDTGPWLQSTIEPDLGRVPLELGYGCK